MHQSNKPGIGRVTVVMILFLLTLVSCASTTQLYERWHDEQYFGPKLQKLLVVGIFNDDIQRRAFEAEFVKIVNSKGKHAVAGYTLMPNKKDFDNKNEIAAAVRKIGADAVLITHFKGIEEKERHVPPRVDYVPRTGRYGPYGYGYRGYYGSTFETVYRPGYIRKDSIVRLDTRVYSVKSEKLIWAGKTKSVNVSSTKKMVKELVSLVVNDMRSSGFIP